MRKRIEELAEGKVECIGQDVIFSVSRIEIETYAGEDYTGEFTVAGKNHIPLRGMVYSTNSRMECLTEGVDAEEAAIRYQFHSRGLTEGNVQSGEFVFVCGQGEFTLPFAVSVIRQYPKAGGKTIHNLSDFAKLAQIHWQEAKKVFRDPCFRHAFGEKEEKERLLYTGLLKGIGTDHAMEEFLLSCKLKDPVTLEIDRSEFEYLQVHEEIRQDLILTKLAWGYAEYEITSDAPFLRIDKYKISTEEFLGSEAAICFYVCPDRMHRGKNFGRLTIRNSNQKITVSVCADAGQETARRSRRSEQIKTLQIRLLETYVDYRLIKIVAGRWAALTGKILDDLMVIDPGNAWYRLLKAQALWTNGQRQEAKWLTEEFRRTWKDKKSPQWGYYLYISTLMDPEELFVDRMTEEIEQIYLEHREHMLLFWCLLFLRKDYSKNHYHKLKEIERRTLEGSKSPLFYVEAYCLLRSEPYLMKRLGAFEMKVLNWARKQNVLTRPLAEQVISVFSERIPYHRLVFLLLEACYKVSDDVRTLTKICSYLIRSQKYDNRFFCWYARGVEKKLRITGLYEAYLMSMDSKEVQEVPRIIQMYFKYNNQLGVRQKAVLYVNLTVLKRRQPDAFRQHYAAMEKFAYEQMELGHIDDDLAVIYKEVLSGGIYSAQISSALADVMFMHRLTCVHPDAVRVIVLQNQMKTQKVIPLIGHTAYFPLYSADYAVLIEDRSGKRYGTGIEYQLEKMMYPQKYLNTCLRNSPDKLPLLYYYFAEHRTQEAFEETDLPYFQAVIESPMTDPAYRARLFPAMFLLMRDRNLAEEMEQSFQSIDLSLLREQDRNDVLLACIERKLYDQAFEIVRQYGSGTVEAANMVLLVSWQIRNREYALERTLLLICLDTFLSGKYDETMLHYLCTYYFGPMGTMEKIFVRAWEFGADTKALAERMLVQMLYTSKIPSCADTVYESYEEGGRRNIRQAYLTWYAHAAFTGKREASESFFEALRRYHADGNEMNDVCGLVLLREYSKRPSLLQQEDAGVKDLLRRYLSRGMAFSFYRNLSPALIQEFHLYDKYYLEYRTKTRSQVWVRFIREPEEKNMTEEMPEVYEGIFVKEMILFAGEEVRCQILEEDGGKLKETAYETISCSACNPSDVSGRYGRLNEMFLLQQNGEQDTLTIKMREYEQLDNVVDEAFTIIQ